MNLTDEQIKKIFELASMNEKFESGNVTSDDVTGALIEIERKLYSFMTSISSSSLEDKKILIADDLELSIYQLTTVLKKIGISPYVARQKDEAISEIQKVKFDCIIIDLFIPDSEDGIELVKAAVKKKIEADKTTKIIVISGTDDKSLIERCYEEGIDLYIQKDKDWHTHLLKYLGTAFKNENTTAYSKYVINGNIAFYTVKKFNDAKVYEMFKKDINSSVLTGTPNIILDLRTVNEFEPENAYIFADIYKISAEAGGVFIVLNPSSNIKEAMSFAYLEDAIPIFSTSDEAVEYINSKSNRLQ